MAVLFLLKPDISSTEAQDFINMLSENGAVVSTYLPPRVVILGFADPSFLLAVSRHPAVAFYTQQAVSLDILQYLASEEEKNLILQWNEFLQNDKKRVGENLNWNHPGFSPPDKPPH